MSKIAQDVILHQIQILKNEVESLERVVKDYFLWLDLQRSPATRAPVRSDTPEPLFTYQWHCSECGEWHTDKDFHCPTAAHPQSWGGGQPPTAPNPSN